MTKVIAALAAIAVFGLAGCNTVKGVGKDVSAVGNATQDAATQSSNDLKSSSDAKKKKE
jgi:predicted small secreted protein